MADNGDTLITFSDLTWDANGFYRFDLTSNRSNLTMADGLGLVHVFGHGYDINGSGTFGIDLNDTNYGIWLWDIDVTGEFTYGVYGQNLTNAIFYEVDVSNANHQGLNLHGDNITIAYSDISNIGSDSFNGNVGGMSLQGSGYSVYGATISNLHSAHETYAVGFNSTVGTDNVLSSSTLNGAGSTGWSFGIWSSNAEDGVTIDGVTATGWAWGGGGPHNVNVYDSVFDNASSGNNLTFTDSTVKESDHSLPVYGTPPQGQPQPQQPVNNSGRDVFIGDDSDQVFVGGGGADVMEGGLGCDTFFFTNADALDVLIGFNQGDDLCVIDFAGFDAGDIRFQAHGTYALGSGPVIVQDQYTDTIYFDSDGQGGAAWQAFIYTPGSTLTSDDFHFV